MEEARVGFAVGKDSIFGGLQGARRAVSFLNWTGSASVLFLHFVK